MRNIKSLFVISLLMVLIIFFSRCLHHDTAVNNDPRGDLYAGTNTCISCHRDICSAYSHSGHYTTSASVNNDHLKKLISPSKDRFYFTDSSYIRIEENDHSLSQSYFVKGKENISGAFDISFGSAEKAQTYGYWKENTLYQLPLTWFAAMNTWANSPGFPAGHARFGRVIGIRCFECHASYVDAAFVRSGSLSVSETLDRNSIVYGIDCERCHGPALRHVKFHQENPSVRTARYIVSIGALTRRQQLDACAVCHSGNDQATRRPLFAFVPGDTLSHFYYPDFAPAEAEPDVHGKQLQLLASSMCFKNTGMTCNSCHNAHAPEEDNIATFISRCMDCHRNSPHAAAVMKNNEQRKRDFNLTSMNCIDCHMPLQKSKTIHFNSGTEFKNMPYHLRTHRIGIYK